MTAGDRAAGAPPDGSVPESPTERRRRRALFLSELADARAVRARVAPHRSRAARIRTTLRIRTFRSS